MPRKNLVEKQPQHMTMTELLDELIPKYGEDKASLDSIKKVCDEENRSIKTLITTLPEVSEGKWEHESQGYRVVVNTTKKQSFNEDKLLEILQNSNLNIDGLIKTKEYVDMDVLEDAMYKQLLDHDTMMEIDSCREVKKTQVLTIKKLKED